uniref:Uncharacterized protein n=1 Tax=Chromera velia CCMP2878 TaxID=1169474 RepID=A0A0G4HPT5_9ALVE|eukprot:Cvel_29885.t1-p1 / transcript=Cvel_29885.t1 / gene=Cvel_29885 / organism=Chromera_velia_CCMP2878 / gene_product=hypothetical protein / transcript_product=hypothetical protein / location=Cvel_scaffold4171:7679-9705(+) / protein_length=72 / sequence_SO=supercontig / SO=protein_coding / is_pseudo=false
MMNRLRPPWAFGGTPEGTFSERGGGDGGDILSESIVNIRPRKKSGRVDRRITRKEYRVKRAVKGFSYKWRGA